MKTRFYSSFRSATGLLSFILASGPVMGTVAVSPCGTVDVNPSGGVLLTWMPQVGVLGYRLDIDVNQFFGSVSNIHIESIFPPNVSTTVYGLQFGTLYYWHVASQDSITGNWNSYGNACTFTTVMPSLPPAPWLNFPGNEYSDMSISVGPNWGVGTGPITSSEIQVSTSPTFATFTTHLATSFYGGYAQASSLALSNGGTYYCRARSQNQAGYGPWGEAIRFYTRTLPTPLNLKVFLQGPYGPGEMHDDLRSQGLLPSTNGASSIPPSVMSAGGSNAIVDWIKLVFLNGNTNLTAFLGGEKWMLVQRDGDLVMPDGTAPNFAFPMSPVRIVIRHRNHLGICSAINITANGTAINLDFTQVSTPVYGTTPTAISSTRRLMWAGDASGDGTVKYTGSGNDRDPILVAVGSTTPNNTMSGYSNADINMNGVVKYTGPGNDRDILLTTVGSTTPNSTRTQQLP